MSDVEAPVRTAERLNADQAALQEALTKLNGPGWTPSVEMDLRHDRRWVQTKLRPFLRTLASRRIDRLLTAGGQGGTPSVDMHGIPANDGSHAVDLLTSAGLQVIQDRRCPPTFQTHTKRESALRVTKLRAKVVINDALKHVWSDRQRVGGAEVICERVVEQSEEEEEWAYTAVLKPPHAYASDLLQQWCRAWGLLGLSDLEMREMSIWSTQICMPEWQIDELLVWSSGLPRLLLQAWTGTGAMQGQIRLRGERIAAQHRNTHLLRNVYAIGGREAFEARCQHNDHHLPSGAVRQ